jgi:hypothetical protein
MLNVVMIILIVGAAYWIVSPLLRPVRSEDTSDTRREEALLQLEMRKEVALSAVKELEFDLNMGKISDEDYEALKEQYANDAAGYMKEIDRMTAGPKKQAPDTDKELEEEIRAFRRKPGRFCAQCGTPFAADDKFCAQCGEKLGDFNQG